MPFFVKRGGTLAQLFLECSLSLSFYPTGRIFTGPGRLLLFLTPAAIAGVLPMDAIETGSWIDIFISVMASIVILKCATEVFKIGVKRYQSSSYVMALA